MSQTLEQRLLRLLSNPQPSPKYKLWQRVKFDYDNTPQSMQGRVVGYYWESIKTAIHTDGCPGWWYVIEGDRPEWIYQILEEAITPIEGGSDATADRP